MLLATVCLLASPWALAVPRLAFQTYAVRDLCEKDFAGTLKAAKAMGYEGVETGRFFGLDAKGLRAACDEAGLELVALQLYPHNLTEPQLAETIRFCKECGCRRINVAWYNGGEENPNDWQLLVNVLNHAAEVCAKDGIAVAYHNHDHEFSMRIGDKRVWDWLFAKGESGGAMRQVTATPRFSDLVLQELDCGNCVLGGGDPVQCIVAYPHRNPTVHVMPAIANVKCKVENGKCDGCGVGSARDMADWKRIVPALVADGVEWLVVKPTVHPDSLVDLEASIKYLGADLHGVSSEAVGGARNVDSVDGLIGTDGFGHCFPGATRPFGFVQPSPDTGANDWNHCSGYQYADSCLYGFSQTHLNGTGSSDLGDVRILPFVGDLPNDEHIAIDKESESSVPGHYSVTLSKGLVKVDVTATERVACYEIMYSKTPARLLVDMSWGIMAKWGDPTYVTSADVRFEDAFTLVGSLTTRSWIKRSYSFVLTFDRPIVSHVNLPRKGKTPAPKYIFSFDLRPCETLKAKIALSANTVEDAKLNGAAEVLGWDFPAIQRAACAEWEALLSRVELPKSDEALRKAFYTALYHVFVQPNNIADHGRQPRYSTFSLWDTYRAAHPLYTILAPERVDGFVLSMMADYRKNGFLPVWTLWGEDVQAMIGKSAIPVVVDWFLKTGGATRGVNWHEVYDAVRTTLTEEIPGHGKADWAFLDRYGYYPCDVIKGESVSRVMEVSFDNWCAAQMAERLGHADDAPLFRRRSESWKNVFDSSIGFVRGRDSKGAWRTPYDPNAVGHNTDMDNDFTEGNAWQWTWHVLHDPDGLAAAFGGREAFVRRLDDLFAADFDHGKNAAPSDVVGLIGQYAHGNEPSHHIPYLYQYAGRPDRTAEVVREICEKFYRPTPDGLCGNDDCGQMSAWYIFACLGFYPLNPCSGDYVIGAPQEPEVILHLAESKVFRIVANGLSRKNKYVKSVSLNGRPLDGFILRHADIMRGGELVFEMKGEAR